MRPIDQPAAPDISTASPSGVIATASGKDGRARMARGEYRFRRLGAQPLQSYVPDVSDPDVSVPRYPEIEVRLVGEDGNAFAILGRVLRELRRADVPEAELDEFLAEATSGDYDHLLQTAVRCVSIV
jgi:hypothetical protein